MELLCLSPAFTLHSPLLQLQVHTKKRNRLLHGRMKDLVFVKFNSKLRNKRENKSKDTIEKEVDDIVGDDHNEFITGLVPNPIIEQVVEAQDGASQGEEPTPQVQAKRKRPVRPRKKKLRSLQSLLRDKPRTSSSSESEDGDGDILMQSSDSDNSHSEDD